MQHRVGIGRAGTAIAVVLVAAACAGDPEGTSSPPLTVAAGTSAPAPAAPTAALEMSAEEAVTIALDAVGGGEVVETDVDEFEVPIQVWEVTVVTPEGVRRQVSVDMRNGSIVGDEADD